MIKHNALTITGTVLCSLALAFGSFVAYISINWRHSHRETLLIPLAWALGVVFRIVRPAYSGLIAVIIADLILLYFILGDFVRFDFTRISRYFFTSGSFVICLALASLLIGDWVLRWSAIKKIRGEQRAKNSVL